MAALNPEKSLQDEATCPICLEYFQNPMMIMVCGHNFCRDCISQCCEESFATFTCPHCRTPFLWENLQPNRHLSNIVELAKQFSLRRASKAAEQKLCEKHQEPLKLFCEKDEVAICVVCDRSKTHKTHSVIPMEEAAPLYQGKIERCLEILKEEKGKILSFKSDSANSRETLLSQTKAEKQKLVWEFQQLQQVLEDKKRLLLGQVEELEAEVEKRKEEQANELAVEMSHLDTLVSALEQKYQEPPGGMLQNIGSILNRCNKAKFEPPSLLHSSDLWKRLHGFSRESASLQRELKKFKDTLTEVKWIKDDVMLDPLTAHPRFLVSEDFKSVTWGPAREGLPYSAKKLDPSSCVLGSQGFSSGKHHWTVDVDHGAFWAVGVARASVMREEQFSIDPNKGIWAVGLCNGQYKVLTSPPTILNQSKHVRKIQVCLDCEEKTVAFYDAEEKKRLVLFTSLNTSEKIYPFFQVGDINTTLRIC